MTDKPDAPESSNTAPNLQQPPARKVPGVPFQKGADVRRNRHGRPRSFDQLRKLAQRIAAEPLTNPQTGEVLTRIEVLLRSMSTSKAPADKQKFLEYAFGKVPQPVQVSGADGGPITVVFRDETDGNETDDSTSEAA